MKPTDVKVIDKHNLRHALKIAVLNNDLPAVKKAAANIYNAGYELEDMRLTPALFQVTATMIVRSGFVPGKN